jgi:ABC-type transport system involved in cytochrome c biogenesis permease component
MSFITCKHLRRVVTLAGVLLIGGILLEVMAHWLATNIGLLIIQPIALGMVLISPVAMLVAMALSLLPGTRFKDCIQ